ncbi:MAG: LLM class flavin-dependent oxidoreductase [Gammaproteobacteria bacterium]
MSQHVDFGMFDWIDRGAGSTEALYASRLALVERADEAGFYGYHLSEHHATPLAMAPSPSVFFAAVAARTRRIRFSPMAYLLPLYHPLRLVEEICMLDHLSGGRVEVGISRGVSPYESQAFGGDPARARAIFDEVVTIYRKAMTAPVLNHAGEHFQFANVPMEIEPLQRPYPPLWYPSFSESGAEYAAQNGFHFMSLGPPSLVTHLMSHYREVAAAHANDKERLNAHVTAPKLGAMRQIFVAESDEAAMEVAKPAYDNWYRSITKLWHSNNDNSYDDFFDWDNCLAAETVLVGSVEKVRAQIQQLVTESAINYFVGSFAWGSLRPEDSMASLDRFIAEIVPAIQS